MNERLNEILKAHTKEFEEVSDAIWEHPETRYQEFQSSRIQIEFLKERGFRLTEEIAGIKTAFVAEAGEGKPVIAFLGEFDALPGLSQYADCPYENAIEEGKAGHGCGHNLLGAGAVTGAIMIKRFLEQEGIPGTLRFYGCPEEELLSGKVKMAYYHMFDGCDMALSWHPMSANMIYEEGYLASASAKFYFKGKTSHAAFAPERGRSALDAVELMSVGANYLREHVVDKARIHYTTDSGGFSPNIVPDKASAWYFTRAPHISDVKDILRRLTLVAKGAAMMTETEVETKIEYGCCDMVSEKSFADLTWKNLQEVETPTYTEEEMEFARQLQATVDPAIKDRDQRMYEAKEKALADGVVSRNAWEKAPLTASSDSGDVSQMMPMNLFTAVCWPVGVAPHTWQSCASAGSTIGQKGAFYAAKVIAATAYDLYTQPELRKEIQDEFDAQDREPYAPMYEGE